MIATTAKISQPLIIRLLLSMSYVLCLMSYLVINQYTIANAISISIISPLLIRLII